MSMVNLVSCLFSLFEARNDFYTFSKTLIGYRAIQLKI